MATIGTDISRAALELDRGNLVGIPTETVYGLGGNALDSQSVSKIFMVKNRPSFDPLIIHISHIEYLKTITSELPEQAHQLAKEFWPGPLTLVLPKKNIIPDLVTSGLPTVAVRMPNHRLTLALLEKLDYPLACPSANPFGYISPTTAQHVQNQLGSKIPYILDGGPCTVGIESTIVGFQSTVPAIFRPGGVSIERIRSIIGEVTDPAKTSTPLAPGMLNQHYAPRTPLMVGNIDQLVAHHGPAGIGILSFTKTFDQVKVECQEKLSATGDLEEAAQNLFRCLRKLDAMPINYIFAELVPHHGLGVAINDRLKRAANKI